MNFSLSVFQPFRCDADLKNDLFLYIYIYDYGLLAAAGMAGAGSLWVSHT